MKEEFNYFFANDSNVMKKQNLIKLLPIEELTDLIMEKARMYILSGVISLCRKLQ